jgi:subtilase family serine protease
MQTPGHPQRFLTPEEWNARFAPSAADEQAVVDWAEASGFTVTKRFPNRLLVDVDAPANAVEKTLFTTINRYRIDGKEYYSNDMDPTLPPALALTVQSVTGLNNIQRAASQSRTPQKETAPRRGPFPEGTMP